MLIYFKDVLPDWFAFRRIHRGARRTFEDLGELGETWHGLNSVVHQQQSGRTVLTRMENGGCESVCTRVVASCCEVTPQYFWWQWLLEQKARLCIAKKEKLFLRKSIEARVPCFGWIFLDLILVRLTFAFRIITWTNSKWGFQATELGDCLTKNKFSIKMEVDSGNLICQRTEESQTSISLSCAASFSPFLLNTTAASDDHQSRIKPSASHFEPKCKYYNCIIEETSCVKAVRELVTDGGAETAKVHCTSL